MINFETQHVANIKDSRFRITSPRSVCDVGKFGATLRSSNTESTCELQNVVVNFGATELRNFLSLFETRGRGVLPYISHIGMCRPKG